METIMESNEEMLLIDKNIKQYEFLFRWTGIYTKINKSSRKEMLKRKITYVINFIGLNSEVTGALLWLYQGITQSKSFTELTYVGPCVTFCLLGNAKAIYLIIYRKKIETLLNKLRILEEKERLTTPTEEKDEIIQSDYGFLRKLFNVLTFLYFVLLLGFAMHPLILMTLDYNSTGELKLLLPFFVVYPFDAYDINYWPWVYLHQIWSEIIVVMGTCASDYIFFTFCSYIRTQFLLLKYYIEGIIPPEVSATDLDKEEIRLQLIELIKVHQELISCARLLEELYTKATLMNFFSSSILICLTGFNVTVITDFATRLTFITFLFMSLFQIYFVCLFGDLMMAASMEIKDAVYNSRWYITDVKFAKYVLLIQTRAHKPCALTAYSYYDVNLKAFMRILSTAWSYFALLQTLYGSTAH